MNNFKTIVGWTLAVLGALTTVFVVLSKAEPVRGACLARTAELQELRRLNHNPSKQAELVGKLARYHDNARTPEDCD